ncbi:hypothetical protein, partial [uncultured Lactobacillus sp.]|uniref:hypothetical protein n=1 Tax=uncultured Lactobacillus sp. TaxID=153152 RepID=UPI00263485FA
YLSCAIKQNTDFGAINKLFENIKETNLFVYSQNQAICGVMDWITEDAIIELTAAPKKNLPLKSLRQSLFYYHLVSRQLQLTIENLVVFNPRFGIINHTEVKNISNELLQKIAHKLDSLDQFASVSLSDRLK